MDRELFDSSRINCFWSVLGNESLRTNGGEILRQKQIANALNAQRALQDVRMGRPSHRWSSSDENQPLTPKQSGPDRKVSDFHTQDDYLRAPTGSFWKHAGPAHQNQSETLLSLHRQSNGSTIKVRIRLCSTPLFSSFSVHLGFASRSQSVRPTGSASESTPPVLVYRQRNPDDIQRCTLGTPSQLHATGPIARPSPRRSLRQR